MARWLPVVRLWALQVVKASVMPPSASSAAAKATAVSPVASTGGGLKNASLAAPQLITAALEEPEVSYIDLLYAMDRLFNTKQTETNQALRWSFDLCDVKRCGYILRDLVRSLAPKIDAQRSSRGDPIDDSPRVDGLPTLSAQRRRITSAQRQASTFDDRTPSLAFGPSPTRPGSAAAAAAPPPPASLLALTDALSVSSPVAVGAAGAMTSSSIGGGAATSGESPMRRGGPAATIGGTSIAKLSALRAATYTTRPLLGALATTLAVKKMEIADDPASGSGAAADRDGTDHGEADVTPQRPLDDRGAHEQQQQELPPYLTNVIIRAINRGFEHIAAAEVEKATALALSKKKGKKKNVVPQMPSRRQFHMSFDEFCRFVRTDGYMLAAFFPFVLKRTVDAVNGASD